jgi:hypothetical protein
MINGIHMQQLLRFQRLEVSQNVTLAGTNFASTFGLVCLIDVYVAMFSEFNSECMLVSPENAPVSGDVLLCNFSLPCCMMTCKPTSQICTQAAARRLCCYSQWPPHACAQPLDAKGRGVQVCGTNSISGSEETDVA